MFFSFLFSFQHVHDILRCFTKVIKTSKPHWTGGYHNIPKPQQTRVYHKIAKPQPTTRETLAVSCLQANGGRGGYEHMAQQASRHVSSELPSCGCLPRVVFVALFPPPPVFTRVGDRWVILLSLSLFLPFIPAFFFEEFWGLLPVRYSPARTTPCQGESCTACFFVFFFPCSSRGNCVCGHPGPSLPTNPSLASFPPKNKPFLLWFSFWFRLWNKAWTPEQNKIIVMALIVEKMKNESEFGFLPKSHHLGNK